VSGPGATPAGVGCGLATPLVRDGEALPELLGGCRHPGGLELTERAVGLAGLTPGAVVVDVGCGDGVTADHLARRFGLRVVGIDASAALLGQGRERCPGLDLREGRADRLPLADASADAVVAECVLSILAEPGAAVDEWLRVLRPGGRLLVSDLFRRADPDAARRLLAEHGFVVEVWEDHSGALARLVWDLAAVGALQRARPDAPRPDADAPRPGADAPRPGADAPRPDADGPSDGASVPATLRGGGGLGYYLCVARLGGRPAGDGPAARRGEDET